MKIWMLGSIAASLIFVVHDAPAHAQDYLGSFLDHQRNRNVREHQERMRQPHRTEQQRVNRNQQRNMRGLNARQRACAQRYRTYDPRSNTYTVRPGVRRQCRL